MTTSIPAPTDEDGSYDEFAELPAVAAELSVAEPVLGPARREFTPAGEAGDGELSSIRWGEATPEIVYIHGSGQNAHTWDGVALLVGRPAIAIDLPGHGHSSWRADGDYQAARNAETIGQAGLIPRIRLLVGMSLGGLTAIRFAARHPELVQRLIVVDVTPATRGRVRAMSSAQRGQTELSRGASMFDTLDAMVAAAQTVVLPDRGVARLRRGVRNNARQLPDGRWSWRYDRPDAAALKLFDPTELWADVAALSMPTLLVLGGASAFVAADDVAEFARRCPDFRSATVAGAGHAVQSDRPRELAELILDFGGFRARD